MGNRKRGYTAQNRQGYVPQTNTTQKENVISVGAPAETANAGISADSVQIINKGAQHSMSKAAESIEQMLRNVAQGYVTVDSSIKNTANTDVISAEEVQVFTSNETGSSNALPEVEKPSDTVECNESVLEANAVLAKLKQLGLLSSIKKLVNADGLTDSAIEEAAVAIHMLTDGLTKEQAVVVNNYDNMGVDLMQYVTTSYSPLQMYYIGSVIKDGADPSIILDTEYTVSQMIELQEAVKRGVAVEDYANPHLKPSQLQALRKACELGVDIAPMIDRIDALTWEQIDLLSALGYEGIPIAEILTADAEQYTVEALRETLQTQKEMRDAVKLELTADGKHMIQAK